MRGGRGGDDERAAGASRSRADRPPPRSARAIVQSAARRLEWPAGEDRPPGADRADDAPTRLPHDLRRDLAEADAVLDEVAREIRVALTVIKGRAQLARRRALASGAPDRRLAQAVEEIDRAVMQVERLVRERLLDLGPDEERRAPES